MTVPHAATATNPCNCRSSTASSLRFPPIRRATAFGFPERPVRFGLLSGGAGRRRVSGVLTRTTPRSLLGLSLAYFLVLLDTTVLVVALPGLRASLGGSFAGQQWAVNGYTVAFAASLLTGGAVSDRYGAARVFRAGVVAFGGVSLLCALAPGLWALVGLRALLGLAGALCLSSSLGLIAQLYPDPAGRARAMGVWAAVSGTALAAGPLAGGLLVGLYGWRAVFLINPVLAVAALVLIRA